MSAKKVVTMTFEDRLRRLQEVVTALESGELALEESVNLYREGLGLSRSCREQLEKARNDVRILTEEGTLEPFVTTTDRTASDDGDDATDIQDRGKK